MSFLKAWKSSGLGKTAAAAGRSLITAAAERAMSGGGMYTGSGRYRYKRKYKYRRSIPFKAVGRLALAKRKRPYKGRGMYTGSGEYIANSNQIASTAPNAALFRENTDTPGAFTLSHREFISEIYAPSNGSPFETRTIGLNAGLDDCFPFLSQLASSYQIYDIVQLAFTFKTSLSLTAGQETSLGDIILCADMDATANDPTNQTDLESRDPFVIRSKINEDCRLFVERDTAKLSQAHRFLKVRVGPIKPGQSLTDYDIGKLFITLSGVNPVYQNQIIGRIYVDYTVRLLQPRLGSNIGLTIDKDSYITSQTDLVYKPQVTSNNALPFGSQFLNSTIYREDPFLYKGAYNTLGTKLEWKQDSKQLKITFPAQKSGFFEVKLTYARETASSGFTCQFVNGSGTNPPVALQGNVSYHRDLPQAGGGVAYSWHDKSSDPVTQTTVVTNNAWNIDPNNNAHSSCVMHFMVQSATTIDNCIILSLNWVFTTSSNITFKYLRLDITELNAIDMVLGTANKNAAARFIDTRSGLESTIY